MQLNLNNFQEEVYLWKNVLRRKDKEIETLHQNIENSQKEIKVLEETRNGLLQEVGELNSILSTLHASLSRLENHEEEKKVLLSENKRLEDCIHHQKKLHEEEIIEMNSRIENLKLECRKETEEQLLQLESKVSAKHESYKNVIKEKDKHIVQLEAEVSKIKSEKDQDLMKLKVEYEEIMSKMKNKLLKTKVSNSLHHDGFFKDDIFRQKYLKLEKEARDENELLRTQIQELQFEMDTLKKQTHTTPPSLVEDAPKSDLLQSMEQDSLPRKRMRLEQDDKYQGFSNIKNKIMSDSTHLVRPVKKKLFNLDFNYF